MRRHLLIAVIFVVCTTPLLFAQASPSEQVQVGPPPVRRAEPPGADASPEYLEQRGDELRAEKAFLESIDYYHAALKKNKKDVAGLYNKLGIAELQLQRNKEARKDFERAIKIDRTMANAINNLGVVRYQEKKYGKAIKQYEKAIKIKPDSPSFYSNLGAAYFAKKEYVKATMAYAQALQLDPDIFERTSRAGVAAQLSSPEDRARFDYVLAKLYAKAGDLDRSLQSLRRAMEEGYKGINDVYKDAEFAGVRKDPRFQQLMADRPPAIPE